MKGILVSNEAWYHLFSSMIIVAAVIFSAVVIIAIVRMIVKWRSPEVQELEGPVRQYLLSDAEKQDYQQQYE